MASIEEFESVLVELCHELTAAIQAGEASPGSAQQFEAFVRNRIGPHLDRIDLRVENPKPHPHVFPDLLLGEFGIELKHTSGDSWRTVGNSVFEGGRGEGVRHVYVVMGKMGGIPAVRWSRYEDAVIHVRTSHRPRFEIEIDSERSLFRELGIGYDEFRSADEAEKMKHIRAYARSRLGPNERLWWLPESPDDDHSLPIQVRLYMNLDQEEKRRLRAEATLLCPQVARPPRAKGKYDDVANFLLTYRGVLASQARDLFSAGSVAHRTDDSRGGHYITRAIQDIEPEMRRAAEYLEDELFVEYWGDSCAPADRIDRWLQKADIEARDSWTPSDVLFLDR